MTISRRLAEICRELLICIQPLYPFHPVEPFVYIRVFELGKLLKILSIYFLVCLIKFVLGWLSQVEKHSAQCESY